MPVAQKDVTYFACAKMFIPTVYIDVTYFACAKMLYGDLEGARTLDLRRDRPAL